MNKRQKTSLQQQSNDEAEVAHDDNVVFLEEQKQVVEELFEKTDSYIRTNVNLLKLKTVDKTATLVSSLTANLTLFLLCFMLLLLISVGVAIWVGQDLNNMPLGFMIVAGVYVLLIVSYLLFGKKVMKKVVNESVISKLIK